MHDGIARYVPLIIPIYIATVWIGVTYLTAAIGGWKLLTRRFRMQGEFFGQKWRFESAQMRYRTNYGSCLTIGANGTGLFAKPLLVFRLWHPPLFVPWTEITVVPKKVLLWNMVEYRLGREEQIPFRVRPRLAQKIQAAAMQTGAPMPIN